MMVRTSTVGSGSRPGEQFRGLCRTRLTHLFRNRRNFMQLAGPMQERLLYTVRLALLIVFAALLTLTTVPVAMTDGLERLLAPLRRFKLPVHEFAFMMTLALRFIPILIQEGERVKNAQLSRGASLEGPLMRRIRNMIPMLLPLFISAIRRADDLAIAMAARNYTGGEGRTSYSQLALCRADYITVTLSILLLSAVLLFRL